MSACSAQPLRALLHGSLLYWVPGCYPLPQTQLPSGQWKSVEILTKLSSVLGRQASGASCRCPEVPNPPTGYTTLSKLSCLSLHFLISQMQIALLRMNLRCFDMDVALETVWSKPPSPLGSEPPVPLGLSLSLSWLWPQPLHWGPGTLPGACQSAVVVTGQAVVVTGQCSQGAPCCEVMGFSQGNTFFFSLSTQEQFEMWLMVELALKKLKDGQGRACLLG